MANKKEKATKKQKRTSVLGRISTHADPTRGQRSGRIGRRTGHACSRAPCELHTRIYPIFGFWVSKVFQNERFPAQDADEPPCKI